MRASRVAGVAFDDLIPSLRQLCDQHGVAALYLFGSHARGTATGTSDVDVGVLFDVDPPRTLDAYPIDLVDRLEALFGREVDLVVLNQASPDLAQRVIRGRLLVNRNPSRRVAFEVRKLNEFFDIQTILRRYRRAALDSVGRTRDGL